MTLLRSALMLSLIGLIFLVGIKIYREEFIVVKVVFDDLRSVRR